MKGSAVPAVPAGPVHSADVSKVTSGKAKVFASPDTLQYLSNDAKLKPNTLIKTGIESYMNAQASIIDLNTALGNKTLSTIDYDPTSLDYKELLKQAKKVVDANIKTIGGLNPGKQDELGEDITKLKEAQKGFDEELKRFNLPNNNSSKLDNDECNKGFEEWMTRVSKDPRVIQEMMDKPQGSKNNKEGDKVGIDGVKVSSDYLKLIVELVKMYRSIKKGAASENEELHTHETEKKDPEPEFSLTR